MLSCVDVKTLFPSSTVLDLASKGTFLVLLQMIIWSLQMSTQKEMDVLALLTMDIYGASRKRKISAANLAIRGCTCGVFQLDATVVYHSSSDRILRSQRGFNTWCRTSKSPYP